MSSKRFFLRRAVPLMSAVALLAVVSLAAALAYALSERRAFERLDDAAAHQLELYAAVLDIELAKQADLPGLIDADGEIDALLEEPTDAVRRGAVNRRLTRFVARSGALLASVTDARGRIVASSDWYRPETRIDRLMPNEPCMGEALAGQEARRFAPDVATGAPEVCYARPLLRGGTTQGAVLVRVSLEPIEATWVDAAFRAESEKPLVVDAQGVVVMSSVPAWKRLSLPMLTLPERALPHGAELVRMRPAAADVHGPQVLHERPIASLGWRLLILSSASPVARDARAAAWGGAAIAGCLGLLAVVWWQRRRVVAQKLAAREALQRANDELEAKVRQRTDELMQAGKLALLGQLSAGISHELGQPLTALRALAENGRVLLERGRPQQAGENFATITGLAERMGRITSQLKSFARKAPADERCLPLQQAIANVQQLLAARLRDEHVMLRVDVPPTLQVRCDGYRLEQVLVNLMANAIDAMAGCERKELTSSASAQAARVVVRVADSGPGIAPGLGERLFEPFFTTKPPGEGLGLGLVISSHIVRDFGGVLRAVSAPAGAVFEFDVAQAPTPLQGEPCSTDTTSP